jgi:uncharacterized protein
MVGAMHIQWGITAAGLLVGLIVGMTGMGGGALMTPILVLFFKTEVVTAITADLISSLIMKPVGAAVHMHKGTVNKGLVKYLVIGSVPFAFAGAFVIPLIVHLNAHGHKSQAHLEKTIQHNTKIALGYALILLAVTMVARYYLQLRAWKRDRDLVAAGGTLPPLLPLRIRPALTMLIGAVGGLLVGMTSTGSGSLIIVCLMLLYPRLSPNDLVGTDLVQAIPLVGAAALGHVVAGGFSFPLTLSLVIGAVPGCYIGARVSSRAPGMLIRRVLVVVLVASGLALLGVPNNVLYGAVIALAILGPIAWGMVRRSLGFSWRYHPQDEEPIDPAHIGDPDPTLEQVD